MLEENFFPPCSNLLSTLTASNVPGEWLATVLNPKPHWYFFTRKDYSKSSSCFCETTRTQDLVDLEENEPNLLVLLGPQVERASGDLVLCDIVIDGSLDDAFGTALNISHVRKVEASGGCQLKTGRGVYGTQCEKSASPRTW